MIIFDSFEIQEAMILSLDTTTSVMPRSDYVLDVEDELVENLITTALETYLNSRDVLDCKIPQSQAIYTYAEDLAQDNTSFEDTSNLIAKDMFDIFRNNPKATSGVLLSVRFTCDDEDYWAVFKYNFKEVIVMGEYGFEARDEIKRTLETKKTIVLTPKSKFDEGFIIDLHSGGKVSYIGKKYKIQDELIDYLPHLVFGSESKEMTTNNKIKVFNKVNKNLMSKYFQDKALMPAVLKAKISTLLIEDENMLQTKKLVEQLFEEGAEDGYYDLYKDAYTKAGIWDITLEPTDRDIKKMTQVQYVSDTNIKMDIPAEYYNDISRFELKVNEDTQTYDLILRSINTLRGE